MRCQRWCSPRKIGRLDEPFLESNGNVRLARIIGASRPNQSRIIAPRVNEDISSRVDVQSTVRNDVGEADKLDASVQISSTDECNTASSRIVEGSPESIFSKVVEKSDSSERMKPANSLSLGLQIPYWFAILVAAPPLLRSPTLSVYMGVCLRSTSSGV